MYIEPSGEQETGGVAPPQETSKKGDEKGESQKVVTTHSSPCQYYNTRSKQKSALFGESFPNFIYLQFSAKLSIYSMYNQYHHQ